MKRSLWFSFLLLWVPLLASVPDIPQQPLPDQYTLLFSHINVTREGNDIVFHVAAHKRVETAYLAVGFLPRPDALYPVYRRDMTARPKAAAFDMRIPLNKLKEHFLKRPTLLYWRLDLADGNGRPERMESRVLLSAAGDPLPTVVLGPFLDRPDPDRYVVSFDLSQPAAAAVVMDGKRFVSPEKVKHHEITIGLPAPGHHSYRVEGDPRTFSFRVRDTGPLSFAVMSDSRAASGGPAYNLQASNSFVLRRLFEDAWRREVDVILFPGDLVNGYTPMPDEFERELRGWAWSTEPVAARIPVFEGMGNHEALVTIYRKRPWLFFDRKPPESTEDVFGRVFVNPENGNFAEKPGLPSYRENAYWFMMRDCLFIMANSNYWVGGSWPEVHGGNLEGYIMEKQMAWIEQVLKEHAGQAKHVFFLTHEPAFPVSEHMKDGMYWWGGDPKRNDGIDRGYVVRMRDRLLRLLDRYGVRLVFFGDEHNYSRVRIDNRIAPVKGVITQIITGGAGAPFYELADEIPWRDHIEAFGRESHYVLVTVKGDSVEVEVIGITGHLLDRFCVRD